MIMKKRVNKNGSHVGMILSFVIFITFIVFLYTVIKPTIQTGEDKKIMVEETENQIIQSLSSNLTVASFSISSTNKDSCLEMQNFLFDLFNSGINYNYNLITKDSSNTRQPSYQDSAYNLVLSRTDTTNSFFKVYLSPKFPSVGASSCSKIISEKDYNFGSVDTGQYIYLGQAAQNDGVFGLINSYNTNYESLKTQLKITPGNEFWFSFKESDGNVDQPAAKQIPSTNVYADELPVQYFDSNANLLSGYLDVKIW